MKLNETTLADVMTYMATNMTDNANVDFDFKGHKARLEIKLVSRDEVEDD